MIVGGAASSISLPLSQCVVPPNVNGPVALYITSDDQPLANNVRDQATDKLIAGPTMAYIDIVPEQLASFARTGSAGSSGSSSGSASPAASTETSVTTITPEQASSVLSSATATDAAATASGTASAASPAATASNNSASGSTSVVLAPGGPNMYTGPVSGGSLTVLGWSAVPAA